MIGAATSRWWVPEGARILFLACLAMLPFLLIQWYLRTGFLVQERFRWYNAIQPLEKALAAGLVLACGALAGWSALHAALPMLLALAASVAAGCAALGPWGGWPGRVTGPRFLRMLRFGGGIFFGQACFSSLFQVNVVLVGQFSGKREAGLYAIAALLGGLLMFLPRSVNPVFSRRLNELEAQEGRGFAWRVSGAMSLALGALGVALFLAAPWGVRRFLPEYVGSLPMLRYLLPAGVAMGGAMFLLTHACYAPGRRVWVNLAPALALALDLALSWHWVPREGGVGAARAFCLSSSAMAAALALDTLRSPPARSEATRP